MKSLQVPAHLTLGGTCSAPHAEQRAHMRAPFALVALHLHDLVEALDRLPRVVSFQQACATNPSAHVLLVQSLNANHCPALKFSILTLGVVVLILDVDILLLLFLLRVLKAIVCGGKHKRVSHCYFAV
jgi:hypothetical protein